MEKKYDLTTEEGFCEWMVSGEHTLHVNAICNIVWNYLSDKNLVLAQEMMAVQDSVLYLCRCMLAARKCDGSQEDYKRLSCAPEIEKECLEFIKHWLEMFETESDTITDGLEN